MGDFLKKTANLSPFPDDFILCTIDEVGLYPNMHHEEGFIVIRKALDTRKSKTTSTDSLIELGKRSTFRHDKSVFKQLRGTALGTKMAPLYTIIFSYSWTL